jgi:hypothetical protein
MAFSARDRWGGMEPNPSVERLREILLSLEADDQEHPDVALKHETEWCLIAFHSGLVIWENVEDEDVSPQHMTRVPREKVLELWLKLTRGEIAVIEAEPWLPGYG